MNRHSQVRLEFDVHEPQEVVDHRGVASSVISLIDYLTFEMLDVGGEFELTGLLRNEIEPFLPPSDRSAALRELPISMMSDSETSAPSFRRATTATFARRAIKARLTQK